MVIADGLAREGLLQVHQSQRQHAHIDAVIGDDAGPEVGVPAADEGHEHHRDQRGLAHGHHDAEDHAQLAHAVHARGVQIAFIHAHERLAQHEDGIGRYRAHDDQAQVGVFEPRAGDHHVQGHKRHLDGHHHRAQHKDEHGVLAAILAAGEGIRGQDARAQLQQHAAGRDDGGVEHIAQEGLLAHDGGIVGKLPFDGQQGLGGVEHLILRLERGGHHPEDGKDKDQRNQQRKDKAHGVFGLLYGAHVGVERVAVVYGFYSHASAPLTHRNARSCW